MKTRMRTSEDEDEGEAVQDEGEGDEGEGEWSEEGLWALGYREVQRRLKALGQSARGPMDELVPRLQVALASEEDEEEEGEEAGKEAEEVDEEEGEEDEAERDRIADPNDSLFLSHVRMVPKEERSSTIYLGALMWCFDEDPQNRGEPHPSKSFFATKIVEHARAGATYVQADTLMHVSEADLYVVDPEFKQSTDPKNHRAHMNLLFTVESQPLVAVDAGYKGQDAWCIEHRTTSAGRAQARINAAAGEGGESDESGDEQEDMDF